MHPADMSSELFEAVQATHKAGWEMPLAVAPSTQPGFRDAYDLNEADGTRIAIVGLRSDAELIAAALTHVRSS